MTPTRGHETTPAIRYDLSRAGVCARRFRDLGIDLSELVLERGEIAGRADLRALIAAQASSGLGPEHVVTTAGAAGAQWLLALALAGEGGGEAIVDWPAPLFVRRAFEALGMEVRPCPRSAENGWRLSVEAIEELYGPLTRVVWTASPHDPTGCVLPEADLCRLAAWCESKKLRLVVDESERPLLPDPLPPVAADLSPSVVTIGSLSKAYGLPGMRMGWVIARDRELLASMIERKATCGAALPALEEAIALMVLEERDAWRFEVRTRLQITLATVRRWAQGEPRVRWLEPEAGTVCWVALEEPFSQRGASIWRRLEQEHRSRVAPGGRFGWQDDHFRVGFGWPTHDDLVMGLAHLSATLKDEADRLR